MTVPSSAVTIEDQKFLRAERALSCRCCDGGSSPNCGSGAVNVSDGVR
jgi:hypothetical protein